MYPETTLLEFRFCSRLWEWVKNQVSPLRALIFGISRHYLIIVSAPRLVMKDVRKWVCPVVCSGPSPNEKVSQVAVFPHHRLGVICRGFKSWVGY